MDPSGSLGSLQAAPIAGAMDRLLAAVIDLLFLGLVGLVVGALVWRWFPPGAPTKLIGFPIAVAYFGLASSKLLGGQTAGMAWRHLTVVGPDGRLLSLPRSLVRAAILSAPWCFNGLYFGTVTPSHLALLWFAGILLFGLAPVSLLLFLALPRRRQFAHDVVVGSFVVSRQQGVPRVSARPPRWVPVTLGLWIAAVGVREVASLRGAGNALPDPLSRELESIPGCRSFQVSPTTFWRNGETSHILRVLIRCNGAAEPSRGAIQQVADSVLRFYPDLGQFNAISISMLRGFDVGLFHWTWSTDEIHSVEEWRQHFGS